MDQQSSCVYGLKQQARALATQLAEPERNRFLVGTCGVRQDNEIHLLDFDEDELEISSHIYRHPHDVWYISPSPLAAELLFTCHSNPKMNGSRMATLWRIVPNNVDSVESGNVLWNPSHPSDKVIALSSTGINIFDINTASKSAQLAQTIPSSKKDVTIGSGAWNPHHSDCISVAAESSVNTYDLRSQSTSASWTIDQAHQLSVKDLDYNPNKPYHLATAGDDCIIRVWDTRDIRQPLKEVCEHSHWVWNVTFNRFHDQLLLSSSSDCTVQLHSLVSISSAPFGHDDVADSPPDSPRSDASSDGGKPTDGVVATYDQHEDSVYSVAWSSGDPWIFASLSYDGRVVVNMVPRAHKYKIILI
ncbi:hypothetical protein SeLEV6574_g07186 [Synchytrium endobioticum]|uniref:EIPR1-like beta-propeller domain-containing protein n=1 Tax=Synchytrium endobioticum TaxID=286115 RepID=A0A507CM05_9FUNG|nr:hypothetical protein SeLEV6574_g07186 [Synchytrium endobioticum]